MTTRLALIRHGAAESRAARDEDRALTPSGVGEVASTGEQLVALGWLPDLGWCSPARRARETRDALSESVGDVPWIVEAGFYRGSAHAVLAALGRLEFDDVTVWAVGHNPVWEDVASLLSGETIRLDTGDAALLERGADGWRRVDVVRAG